MPGGKIPEAAAIAELKGTLPNPKTLQNVFAQNAQIPQQFLGEFLPEDPLTTLGIPQPDLNVDIQFKESELKEEPPINTEGLTEEQIAEEEEKRQRRIERNKKAKEIKDKIKGEAAGFANNLAGQATGAVQNVVAGAQANIVGQATEALTNSPLGGILARVAAYKYFKAQIGNGQEKVDAIKEKIDAIKEKNKDGLKGGTEIIKTGKILEGVNKALDGAAKAAKATTDSMKPTFPSHPGPGNLANSEVSQKTREARDKAKGFAENLKQTLNNVGKFLKDIIDINKNLLKVVLSVIGMLLALLAFIKFLQMLLELLFLLFLKKDSNANGGENNQAKNPDEFLAGINFPGFGDTDFSGLAQNPVISRPLTPTRPVSQITPVDWSSIYTNFEIDPIITDEINPFEPILLGPTQIGIPLIPSDLEPGSGKDFNNHPLLGDLTGINSQIINELYNNGVLPKVNQPALDPNQYSEDLDKLYDDIVNELVETKQIEYIEKLYNIDFEMIGYKRYRA